MLGHRRRGVGTLLLLCAAVVAALAGAAGSATAAAPTNDAFADALPVGSASSGGPIAGSNVDATREAAEPLHNASPGGHSIWYKWAAPDAGPFAITASGIGGNVVLAVYTGPDLGHLTEEASNSQGTPSKVCVTPPPAGTTFWIALDGYGGETGPTSL